MAISMKPPSATVLSLRKAAAAQKTSSASLPGLFTDDPPVPRELLGWGNGPLAVALMGILKSKQMVFPDKSGARPEYLASPCSGWDMLGRDDFMAPLHPIAAEETDEKALKQIKTALQAMKLEDVDAADASGVLAAVDKKMQGGSEMKREADMIKSFYAKTHRLVGERTAFHKRLLLEVEEKDLPGAHRF